MRPIPTNGYDEAALIPKVARGDRDAEDAIVQAYLQPVHDFVMGRVFSRVDAEDIVNQGMIKIVRALRAGKYECRTPDGLARWILRIMRRTVLDHQRKVYRMRATFVLHASPDIACDPFELERLENALSRLSAGERVAIKEYVIEGKVPREWRELNTLRVKSSRGLKKLRVELQHVIDSTLATKQEIKTQCPTTMNAQTTNTDGTASRTHEPSRTMLVSGHSSVSSTDVPTVRLRLTSRRGSSHESAAVPMPMPNLATHEGARALENTPHRAIDQSIAAEIRRLEGKAKRSSVSLPADNDWLRRNIVLQIARDPSCDRLKNLIDSMPSGQARADMLAVTLHAMHELWCDLNRRGPAEPTPHGELESYLDRGASRLMDALKQTGAALAGSDRVAVRSAIAAMLQGLLRAAAADEPQNDREAERWKQSGTAIMTFTRDAFMRFAVRTGRAFDVPRIMAAFKATEAEARQRKRRGRFTDEEIATLLELPVSAVQTLSTPNPSTAALNQLLKHTGFRDTARQTKRDASVCAGIAAAAHSADGDRIEHSELAKLEVDDYFEQLETKFRKSKDSDDD